MSLLGGKIPIFQITELRVPEKFIGLLPGPHVIEVIDLSALGLELLHEVPGSLDNSAVLIGSQGEIVGFTVSSTSLVKKNYYFCPGTTRASVDNKSVSWRISSISSRSSTAVSMR